MRKPLLFVDMDGTLAEWNTSLPKFAKEIFMPGYFKDRPAYPMVAQAIRLLICSGALEVFVISSVIDEPHVIADKNSWLTYNIHKQVFDKSTTKRVFVYEKEITKHAACCWLGAVPCSLRW